MSTSSIKTCLIERSNSFSCGKGINVRIWRSLHRTLDLLSLVGLGARQWGKEGRDWLGRCRRAQLDILERSPHPSDSWAALFLGHPGRHLRIPARPRMLLTAAAEGIQPTSASVPFCQQVAAVVVHTQPNQYHTTDRTCRNNSCHCSY